MVEGIMKTGDIMEISINHYEQIFIINQYLTLTGIIILMIHLVYQRYYTLQLEMVEVQAQEVIPEELTKV